MAASVGIDGQRVLIVEDEQALAKAMARTMKSRGFQADVALTGAEARQLFNAVEYGLVLMDIRLPDESGYGLLDELNQKSPRPAVVMISGVDDPELGRAAVDHGAYGYYVKPVGATELYLAVVNGLRRRSVELEYDANLKRLESMVAERSTQMARAAALQAGMLPESPFKGDGFEIAAHFTPAREISGDFYDWHQPDPRFVAVTLGDVMGKGLPAAIMMATVRAALRGAVRVENLEEGVLLAAKVMSTALEVNHAFVTLFHAVYETETGDLHYIDAGHGYARLLRGMTGQELLSQRSAPIGIFPDSKFEVGTAHLDQGDTLVVFSDGLIDLRPDLATRDVPLPYDARRAATAQELVDIMARDARNGVLADDVTVLAMKRL
ncbi:MAG TPA: SpoIIE family protein phosphatase [Candidatus Dormibacteraeota bacterium]|jgi:serine phosphatase RsbU (regulator of sigma subunit)|nr:SpoIIE family protein phosphatase [Candidatus Dormibacteraeota bacterium]